MLQDKRFKNRELQIIRMMEHPNVVMLKHCFFSVTDSDERFLHLVLEFIPSTVYKCAPSLLLRRTAQCNYRRCGNTDVARLTQIAVWLVFAVC